MKFLITWLLSAAVVAISAVGAVSAYTPTSTDQELLNWLFERIETVFLHDTAKLLTIYEAFPAIQAQYSLRPQHAYVLERMYKHIKLVLFTSVYEDQFVCLPSYVQEGDTVEMDYALHATDGSLLTTTWETMEKITDMVDTKTVFMPVAFNPGKGQVLPGFDAAVLGTKNNEKIVFMISPEEGFGQRHADLLKIVSRTSVEEEIGALEDGKPYTLTMSLVRDGETLLAVGRIIDSTAETVTIDFNHPYAGQDLLGTLQVEQLKKWCAADVFPIHNDKKGTVASSGTKNTGSSMTGTSFSGGVRMREGVK